MYHLRLKGDHYEMGVKRGKIFHLCGFCECGSQVGCSLERPTAQVDNVYQGRGKSSGNRVCPVLY